MGIAWVLGNTKQATLFPVSRDRRSLIPQPFRLYQKEPVSRVCTVFHATVRILLAVKKSTFFYQVESWYTCDLIQRTDPLQDFLFYRISKILERSIFIYFLRNLHEAKKIVIMGERNCKKKSLQKIRHFVLRCHWSIFI